jgi:hypothetical protein
VLVRPEVEREREVERVARFEVALVLDGIARLVEDPLDLGGGLLGDPALGVGDGRPTVAVVEILPGDVIIIPESFF